MYEEAGKSEDRRSPRLMAVEETARHVRAQLEPTTERIVEADGAELRAGLDSVSWERRGLLGRLTRKAA